MNGQQGKLSCFVHNTVYHNTHRDDGYALINGWLLRPFATYAVGGWHFMQSTS